jgi:hypothetical protein
MSHGRQLLPPKEQAILEIIESHNALISIVFDTGRDENGWDIVDYTEIDTSYLNQIAEPNKYRPSRYVDFLSHRSYFPSYDFPMISLAPTAPISADAITKAQTDRAPIVIKRGDDQYSIYNYDYYREPNWQETPFTDLDEDDKNLLQRLPFDGRIIKKEDGLPYTGNPDIELLYSIVTRSHCYLPAVINKINMQTLKVHQHHPGQDRFTEHKGETFIFTPKTSTSLIPPNPIWMELFHCDYGIGFLWHINDCNLKKEKYVFPFNASTDSCYWIDLDAGYGYDYQTGEIRYITAEEKITRFKEDITKGMFTLATVKSLREQNLAAITNKQPIAWNELVVGLPAGLQKETPDRNIRAIFATQDVRNARLRALRAMQHVKEKHNLSEDLPLFILEPKYAIDPSNPYPDPRAQRDGVFRFYLRDEQETDLLTENADLQVAQATSDIIKNQRALALTVSNKNVIDHYFEQPQKTALLPSDPQWMKLSDDDQPTVGLLWDINACDLDDASRAMVDPLRAKNTDAVNQQQVINHNTLPAGLPKGRIDGVFCYNSAYLAARLKAQELAAYAKEKFQLKTNIPIYCIQLSKECHLYTDLNQLIDQNEARGQGKQAVRMTAASKPSKAERISASRKLPHRLFTRSANITQEEKHHEEDRDWTKISKEELREAKTDEINQANNSQSRCVMM